jgi:hypothetical protein
MKILYLLLLLVLPYHKIPQCEDAVVLVQEHTQVTFIGVPLHKKLVFWNPYTLGKKEVLGVLDVRSEEEYSKPTLQGRKMKFFDRVDGVYRTVYFMHFIKTRSTQDLEYENRSLIPIESRKGLTRTDDYTKQHNGG